MKNVLRLLIIAALAAAFTLPALAQTGPGQGGGIAAGQASTQDADAKAALYKKFLANYKGTPDQQKVAYETGKEYLSKYSSDTSADNAQIVKFIQNWVTKYEAVLTEFNCTDAVNKNPKQAYQACEQLRAKNPDDLKVYLLLVAAGVNNAMKNDKSMNAQTIQTARRALDLISQGKTADSYAPFANQQEAVAGLNYYIGAFSYETDPDTAAAALLKAAQATGKYSKEPTTFQYLGLAYYNGEFKKLAQQYKDQCEGKPASPECDALFARVNQVLDRVIDAYARSVALGNNALKPSLTTIYKQRHDGNDAGLNEYIAGVLNKPLPIPGQEPSPTVTPSSSSGTTGTDGNGTTAKPAATPPTNTKPASTTTTTPAKPATTTPKPPVTRATPAAKSGAAATSGH